MRNDNPDSSFHSPEDYRQYAKEAHKAVEVYQRIRRPLMFHVLVVWLLFIPKGTRYYTGHSYRNDYGEIITELTYYDPSIFEWMFNNAITALPYTFFFIILLGVLSLFRRLNDGFQSEDSNNPVFTLSTQWVTINVVADNGRRKLRKYKKKLKKAWFWKTWTFYPILFINPLLGFIYLLIVTLKNGWGFFMDLFFLNCWDRWLKALESEEDTVLDKHLRGNQLEQMPQSAGSSPIQWVKKKAGQAKNATITFLEKCSYDEAEEKERAHRVKIQEKPKAKTEDSQDNDKGSTANNQEDRQP